VLALIVLVMMVLVLALILLVLGSNDINRARVARPAMKVRVIMLVIDSVGIVFVFALVQGIVLAMLVLKFGIALPLALVVL
jgi:hypothetical protein